MKVLIILGLTIAALCVSAEEEKKEAVFLHPLWYPSASHYQAKDTMGNYVFGHQDNNSPQFHTESGGASGAKIGSYGVKYPDGKVRIVEYVADQDGFKANIKTTEKLDKDHKDPVGVKTTEMKPVVPVVYGHPYLLGHPYYVAV